MKPLLLAISGLAIAIGAAGPANAWGCKLFDAITDRDCPPHPDYVSKRVNFFCGENPRHQFLAAAGDCRREGIAYDLQKFTFKGRPAVRWSVKGQKSRTTLATGCFCVIDER